MAPKHKAQPQIDASKVAAVNREVFAQAVASENNFQLVIAGLIGAMCEKLQLIPAHHGPQSGAPASASKSVVSTTLLTQKNTLLDALNAKGKPLNSLVGALLGTATGKQFSRDKGVIKYIRDVDIARRDERAHLNPHSVLQDLLRTEQIRARVFEVLQSTGTDPVLVDGISTSSYDPALAKLIDLFTLSMGSEAEAMWSKATTRDPDELSRVMMSLGSPSHQLLNPQDLGPRAQKATIDQRLYIPESQAVLHARKPERRP